MAGILLMVVLGIVYFIVRDIQLKQMYLATLKTVQEITEVEKEMVLQGLRKGYLTKKEYKEYLDKLMGIKQETEEKMRRLVREK